MATEAVDSSSSNQHLNCLHLESLPVIDLRFLCQSELLALSLCSSSSSSSLDHLRNDTDDFTLRIDRSVFNESAGSRKQTFSRLRLAPRNKSQFSSSASNQTPGNFQGTEQLLDEENSQIITLLRSLFGADTHSNDNDNNLISVPIHYDEYLFSPFTSDAEAQNVRIRVVDSSSGPEIQQAISSAFVDSSSKKRKRGRPRKNWQSHNDNNIQLVERETDEIETKTVAMKENVKQEKEELVVANKNGAVVDLAALGSVEDLFGEELRRRTEGMRTEEAFLGFLQGLEGEWSSGRKKRKIVDASNFGDALPKGWKLMLCLKRKAGHIWLGCRRYISPNGKQFVSCKEVSSYLLSNFGLQAARQTDFCYVDGASQLTDKITSENATELTVKDDKNENNLICCSSKSIEHEKQATSRVGGPRDVQEQKKYKCHKCSMAFDEQDGLLEHLLSAHHGASKKLRHGTSMSEQVIIKNGKYECQFCQKSFEERHRYNGHLGNHIKDYFKRINTSDGVKIIQKNTLPSSIPDVLKTQHSAGIFRDCVARSSTAHYYETTASTSVDPYYGKQDRVCNVSNCEVERMNEATEVVAAEPALLPSKNNDTRKSSDENNYNLVRQENNYNCFVSVAGKDQAFDDGNNMNHVPTSLAEGHNQDRDSESGLFASVDRVKAFSVGNNPNQVPTTLIEEYNWDRGSESGLLAPDAGVKAFSGENIKDGLLCGAIGDMDREFVGKDELITGFGNIQVDAAANIKKQRCSEGCSDVSFCNDQRYGSVNNKNGFLTSIMVETMQERDLKLGLQSSTDEKTFMFNNIANNISTSTLNESRFSEVDKSGNHELTIGFGSSNTVPTDGTVTGNEKGTSYGSCLVIPPWNEQIWFGENNMNATSKCTMEKFCQEKEYGGSLLSLSGSMQSFGFKNDVVKVSDDPMRVFKCDQVRCSENSKFSGDVDLVEGSVTNIGLKRSSDRFLHVQSANEQIYVLKDYGVCNSTLQKLTQGRNYENRSHGPSFDFQPSDYENNVNKVSCITMEEHKHKEARSSCNGEPQTATGHGQNEHDTGVVTSTVQESCSLVLSGNHQVHFAKDNVTDLYGSTVDELKQKRDSVESSLCPSGSEHAQGLNRVLTGTAQEEPRLENLQNPRKNELVIGSSNSRPNENAASEFTWRTEEENFLLNGFAGTSPQLMQSSGCFPAYDVTSYKGESELFSEKFDGISGLEGPRSEMAQGFDSSVWLEKEALPLFPNIASWRCTPIVCVSCRIEFHQEAFESEPQTGSMGFMCAVCKARFSG